MLAVEIAPERVFRGAMSKAPARSTPSQDIQTLASALRRLREHKNLTQQQAADAAEMTRQAWQNYEAGARQAILRSDMQIKLAEALGASRGQLLEMARSNTSPGNPGLERANFAESLGDASTLPIRDRVQAGLWAEADDLDQTEPVQYPHPRDPRYPHGDQWLSRVVGDSVNTLGIFDGDLIHCVDIETIGHWPKTGDIVEVERTRMGGLLRELTVKQVELTPDGIKLWPRSTNPRFVDPIEVTNGTGEGEEFVVRVRGLVIGSRRIF